MEKSKIISLLPKMKAYNRALNATGEEAIKMEKIH